MDRFDKQIARLKLKSTSKFESVRLDEGKFMEKLVMVRRARRMRRVQLALLALAAVALTAGAVRRNIIDVLTLTVRYFADLPSMLTEFLNAYVATVSWPSLLSFALVLTVGIMLIRSRRSALSAANPSVYQVATAAAALALVLGFAGLFGGTGQAAAQQEILRRTLNERGHLEVSVSGKDYELYGQSDASDESIRNQAFIEEVRQLDISKIYPELSGMQKDGFVAEVRAVNKQDDCVFYVERRLEPALNQKIDANSTCISSDETVYYIDHNLKPAKTPRWKKGQAIYVTYANGPMRNGPPGGMPTVVVLLKGKADSYVPDASSRKLVPKGHSDSNGVSCGIDLKETCPHTSTIDIFTNANGDPELGKVGSSVWGDSLRPRAGSEKQELFGKLVSMDDKFLRLQTVSGRSVIIAWPRNYIEAFNQHGALNYNTATGKLHVEIGDSLRVRIHYKDGMDLEKLSISDVEYIAVATKAEQHDPLSGKPYPSVKSAPIEKY